ncbi:uncharacterized protein [Ptychodera flava]|uniref:uncharacterized protein n=1 Tax=Ptychodera flava TaxID=63121 RepID=UPI00396A3A03
MSSHACLNALRFRFYAILVFICGLLPAVLAHSTTLGRGGRCFDYQQRCVRDSTCAYTFLLQTDSDHCDGLEETLVKMSEVNTATQTQLERVEALERTVAEQANRLETLTAENQRITAETDQMREELSDLKTKCSLCQNGESELEIEDPKFIFNGSSSVTIDRNGTGSAPPLSEFTFCLWIKTRSGTMYDEFTALVHYQAEATVPTPTDVQLADAASLFIGYAGQSYNGLGGGGPLGDTIPTDGMWHHVCFAWYGPIGYGRRWVYVDGTGGIRGDGGYELTLGGGVVYLGHAPFLRFQRTYRFIGEMSQFYMYNVRLDEQMIRGMVRGCSGSDEEGTLFRWPTIVNEERYTPEHIEIHQVDICYRPGCRLETCMVRGACLENLSPGANGDTCICANFGNTCPADQTSSKYILDRSSRVSLSHAGVARNLSAFTFCLWAKTATTRYYFTTLFEFEASGSNDTNKIKSIFVDHHQLVVTKYNDDRHQTSSYIYSGANNGLWHFLCVSGTLSDEASFHIYHNGIKISTSVYRQELWLYGMGTVTLGSSPMKPNGDFQGDMYGFHMWPVDLSENWHQMYYMFRLCGQYITEGAVVNWADFRSDNDNFHGSAVGVEAADICVQEN